MNAKRHEMAMDNYFNQMLHEPQAETRLPVVNVAQTPQMAPLPLRHLEKLLADVPTTLVEAEDVLAEAPAIQEQTVTAPIILPLPVRNPRKQAILEFRQGLPERFQSIVFRVGELRFALPLYLLGGIQMREKEVTVMPGKPRWFLGLLQHEPENIRVIDTARYLIGSRYKGDMAAEYRYIIIIGDSQWGLSCHELCSTVEIRRDDVRWFAGSERRPWLAGMLKNEMCALINSAALTLLLTKGESTAS